MDEVLKKLERIPGMRVQLSWTPTGDFQIIIRTETKFQKIMLFRHEIMRSESLTVMINRELERSTLAHDLLEQLDRKPDLPG